jgi:hypothetical protein
MRDTDPVTPGVQPPIPQDHGSPTGPGVLADPNIPNSQLSLMADLGYNSAAGAPTFVLPGLLPAGSPTPTTRECLGLVLPISVPANYTTVQQAYFADAAGNTVFCDQTDPMTGLVATASVNVETLAAAIALCPNGTRQPCDMPYKFDTTAPNNTNFNCMIDQMNPNLTGVQDMRAYNLHPVTTTGHYLKDNYFNPFLNPPLPAARQARVVTAFYRLHMTRTQLSGPPTGGPCKLFTSTTQVGCLVKASPCSVGFGGRGAVDSASGGLFQNFALRLAGLQPSDPNIKAILPGFPPPLYPMARPLWLEAVGGFPVFAPSPSETALLAITVPTPLPAWNNALVSGNYVPVPGGFITTWNCPAPFGF